MGKGKKRKSKIGKIDRRLVTAGLIGAGVLIAVFGQRLFTKLAENYANGVGVTIKKVRVKFSGSVLSFTIPFTDIKINIPKNVTWLLDTQIRNDNPIGGKILGFDGEIRYGAGQDGVDIAPLTAPQFQLPARGTVTPTIEINQDIWTAPGTVKQIVSKIRDQVYKKVFIVGDLRTSFGKVGISQEVSLLAA